MKKKQGSKNKDSNLGIVCIGRAAEQAREFVDIVHSLGFATTGDLQLAYDNYWQKKDPYRLDASKGWQKRKTRAVGGKILLQATSMAFWQQNRPA